MTDCLLCSIDKQRADFSAKPPRFICKHRAHVLGSVALFRTKLWRKCLHVVRPQSRHFCNKLLSLSIKHVVISVLSRSVFVKCSFKLSINNAQVSCLKYFSFVDERATRKFNLCDRCVLPIDQIVLQTSPPNRLSLRQFYPRH